VTRRPLLIDFYCAAGGSSMGFHRAGFDVVGVDVEPQPRYPFRFIRADAVTDGASLIADLRPVAVAGSPPCKLHTSVRHTIRPGARLVYPVNLIPETRAMFDASGLPYVIENVPGAPLADPLVLCGSMFDLAVRRHRLFELGGWKMPRPACRHREQVARSPGYPATRYHSGRPVTHLSPVVSVHGGGKAVSIDVQRRAMGVDWMTRDELSQAIPPAYTEHVGRALMAHVRGDAS
jgi:DNA (cytosine-5)-methyltransferase 1